MCPHCQHRGVGEIGDYRWVLLVPVFSEADSGQIFLFYCYLRHSHDAREKEILRQQGGGSL